MNALKLSRVFRFVDPGTGAAQISDFPDSDPPGDTPLEVRMKHFTEIENFTFLAYVLAHELGGGTKPIRTMADLQVCHCPDWLGPSPQLMRKNVCEEGEVLDLGEVLHANF